MIDRARIPFYVDTPIASVSFDALDRAPWADRLVELVTARPAEPVVIGLCGAAGTGKTSILAMLGERVAGRGDLHAFAIDAWAAGDAAAVNDLFLREIARIFELENALGTAGKVRERLFELGGVVSAVARLAGVKVDVKSALEQSPDALRDQVVTLTTAIGKRFVVAIDGLDRLAPGDAVAILKLVQRWARFPYIGFVIAMDRTQLAHNLERIDGDADALDRIVAIELAITPPDRLTLAAWIRGALTELAAALALDPDPALALFAVEDGPGLGLVLSLRHAKRLLNALGAGLPLAPPPLDLRGAALLELVRIALPAAYPLVLDRLPLCTDAAARAGLGQDLLPFARAHPRPEAAVAVVRALVGA